jgi:ubiquitin-like 1-activating enzyme E1 B
MSRDSYNKRVLGKELYDKVSNSRILLVGAGGIGCELLKNLVLSGFKTIEVVRFY